MVALIDVGVVSPDMEFRKELFLRWIRISTAILHLPEQCYRVYVFIRSLRTDQLIFNTYFNLRVFSKILNIVFECLRLNSDVFYSCAVT